MYHPKSNREKWTVLGFSPEFTEIGMKYIEFVKFACVQTECKAYQFCEKQS